MDELSGNLPALFVCSVCGQPGASACTAIDSFNDPCGDYVHPLCAKGTEIGGETQSLRGVRNYSVSRTKVNPLPGLWTKRSHVHKFLGTPLQKTYRQKRFL